MFEEWLGREDCPVHWDESANKNAWYGYEAGYAAAQALSAPNEPVSARTEPDDIIAQLCAAIDALVCNPNSVDAWKLAQSARRAAQSLAAQTPPAECIICHWEPDEEKSEHMPSLIFSGGYVCVECITRCKTVTSFGLTVRELGEAAKLWKVQTPPAKENK
jgi:hypothetical protein